MTSNFHAGARRFTKFVASLTLFFFSFSSLSYSAPGISLPEIPFLPQASLELSPELGSVESIFEPDKVSATAPLVYLIQDAHENLDAQENIREILKKLVRESGVSLVLFEGGSIEFNPSIYQTGQGQNLDEKVWDALFKQGEISGLERFSLGEKVKALGIEDEKIYFDNIASLAGLFKAGDVHRCGIDRFDAVLSSIAGRLLDGDLKKLRDINKSFELGKTDLMRYARRLIGWAHESARMDFSRPGAQSDWPQIYRLLKLAELESELSLKQKEVARELAVIARSKATKQSRFVWNTSEHWRVRGRLRWHFERAIDEIRSRGENPEKYPNLKNWMGVQVLQDEISSRDLFSELGRLEKLILNQKAGDAATKKFFALEHDFNLMRKLSAFELSREELAEIKNRNLRVRTLTADLSALYRTVLGREPEAGLVSDPSLASFFDQAMKTYDLVLRRDQVLSENAFRRMREAKAKKVALVAGGFHSSYLDSYFKDKNIRHTLIRPAIRDIHHRLNYRERIKLTPSSAKTVRADQIPPVIVGAVAGGENYKKYFVLRKNKTLAAAASLGNGKNGNKRATPPKGTPLPKVSRSELPRVSDLPAKYKEFFTEKRRVMKFLGFKEGADLDWATYATNKELHVELANRYGEHEQKNKRRDGMAQEQFDTYIRYFKYDLPAKIAKEAGLQSVPSRKDLKRILLNLTESASDSGLISDESAIEPGEAHVHSIDLDAVLFQAAQLAAVYPGAKKALYRILESAWKPEGTIAKENLLSQFSGNELAQAETQINRLREEKLIKEEDDSKGFVTWIYTAKDGKDRIDVKRRKAAIFMAIGKLGVKESDFGARSLEQSDEKTPVPGTLAVRDIVEVKAARRELRSAFAKKLKELRSRLSPNEASREGMWILNEAEIYRIQEMIRAINTGEGTDIAHQRKKVLKVIENMKPDRVRSPRTKPTRREKAAERASQRIAKASSAPSPAVIQPQPQVSKPKVDKKKPAVKPVRQKRPMSLRKKIFLAVSALSIAAVISLNILSDIFHWRPGTYVFWGATMNTQDINDAREFFASKQGRVRPVFPVSLVVWKKQIVFYRELNFSITDVFIVIQRLRPDLNSKPYENIMAENPDVINSVYQEIFGELQQHELTPDFIRTRLSARGPLKDLLLHLAQEGDEIRFATPSPATFHKLLEVEINYQQAFAAFAQGNNVLFQQIAERSVRKFAETQRERSEDFRRFLDESHKSGKVVFGLLDQDAGNVLAGEVNRVEAGVSPSQTGTLVSALIEKLRRNEVLSPDDGMRWFIHQSLQNMGIIDQRVLAQWESLIYQRMSRGGKFQESFHTLMTKFAERIAQTRDQIWQLEREADEINEGILALQRSGLHLMYFGYILQRAAAFNARNDELVRSSSDVTLEMPELGILSADESRALHVAATAQGQSLGSDEEEDDRQWEEFGDGDENETEADEWEVLLDKAVSLHEAGQNKQALETIGALKSRFAKISDEILPEFLRIEAEIHRAMQNWDSAIRIYGQVIEGIKPWEEESREILSLALWGRLFSYESKGQYGEEMIADATRLIDLGHTEALRYRGQAYGMGLNRWDMAKKDFEQLITIPPKEGHEVARAYVDLSMAYEALEDFEQAERCLGLAHQLGPEHPMINFLFALFLFNRGRDEEALRRIDEAILHFGENKNSFAHALRGRILLRLERTEEARKDLELAGGLDMTNPLVNKGLAFVDAADGQWTNAQARLQDERFYGADNLEAEKFELLAGLVVHNEENKKKKQYSVEAARACVKKFNDEDFVKAFIFMIEMVPHAEAIPFITELMAQYGEDEKLLRARAETYVSLKNWDHAVGDYRRALELNPSWRVTPYFRLYDLLMHLGREDEALDILRQANRNIPEDPVILRQLGKTLEKIGRWEESLVEFNRAVELVERKTEDEMPFKSRVDYYESRAISQIILGNEAEAEKDLRRALEMDPTRADIYGELSILESLRNLEDKKQEDVDASSLGRSFKSSYGNSLNSVRFVIRASGNSIWEILETYFPGVYRQLMEEVISVNSSAGGGILKSLEGNQTFHNFMSYLTGDEASLVITGAAEPRSLLLQAVGAKTTTIVYYQNPSWKASFDKAAQAMIRKGLIRPEELSRKIYFADLSRNEIAPQKFLEYLLKGKRAHFVQGDLTLARIASDAGVRNIRQHAVWMDNPLIIDQVLSKIIVRAGLPLSVDESGNIPKEQKEFFDTLRLALAAWLSLDPDFLVSKGYVRFTNDRYEVTESFIQAFVKDALLEKRVTEIIASMA